MNKNSNLVAGVFGLVGAVIAYFASYNVIITIGAFIFAVSLAAALRPFYQGLFEKKVKALPTTITVLQERGFESGAPEERVFYALIITQNIMLDVSSEAQKAILDEIFEKSAAAMTEKYDFFRSRYSDVQTRQMPMKICVGTCGEKTSTVSKCYRDWLRHVNVDNKTLPPKDNIDVFFNDSQFTDPDGITRNAVTAVQFYRW